MQVKSEGYLNGNGIIINEMKRILQNHQVASMELNDIGLKIERLNGSSNDIIDEIIEQIDKAIEKLLRVDLNGNSLNWNLIESENLKDIKRRRH